MQIHFYKYQGAGNDFVMIDNRDEKFPVGTQIIKRLCDRKFGIGADGLILLQNHEGFDFEMVYFNADGNLASMCGNGGRCTAAFAKQLGIGNVQYNFIAVDGPHKAWFDGNKVSLQMKNVGQVSVNGSAFVMDTGSPHYVKFMDKIDGLDVFHLGKDIRNNAEFKDKGINVNFVQMDPGNQDHIHIRTYERGVEDETLACGTGIVASALALFYQSKQDNTTIRSKKIRVSALGGELEVDYDYHPESGFSNIWLCGPAAFVFEGEINQ